jgi:2-haloacid dehalogenase
LYCTLNVAIWQEFERGEITAPQLRIERMRRFGAALGISTDPVAFSDTYLGFLKATPFVLDSALAVVDALRIACRICLLTNGFTAIQYPRIERTGLAPRADAIVVSEEIGCAKPDPAIFDHAFHLLGQPPRSATLVIGDNLTSDIQGGVDYGIDTCWFAPGTTLPDDAPRPTYTIQHLTELLPLVKS